MEPFPLREKARKSGELPGYAGAPLRGGSGSPVASLTPGEVAEWSKAAVLKTVGPKGPGGSNPSLSAK